MNKNLFNKANVVTALVAVGFAGTIYLSASAIMDMPGQLKELHEALKESSED